jgi:hypothetical protein
MITASVMCGVATLGSVCANESNSSQIEVTSSSNQATIDHVECYESSRMSNPGDYCYQNIGPWNSTSASVDEVRMHVSLQSMVQQGLPTSVIQKYYPEYSPTHR